MDTIALRFSDNFAPKEGTIAAHNKVIKTKGFVWYGKVGPKISMNSVDLIMNNDEPRILLIHSGRQERYWANVDDISFEIPDKRFIPEYYEDKYEKVLTWFKLSSIEKAPNNVMSKCIVTSSKQPLSIVSKSSMSPFFRIEYKENE